MIGLNGETVKSALKTIMKAISSPLDFAQFYSVTPYPGTEYYDVFSSNNPEDYFHGTSTLVQQNKLPRALIQVLRYCAQILFYAHPRRLGKIIMWAIRGVKC